jgi:hypothetical protein
MGMPLPHLAQMRSSARLLAGHARTYAHAGDHQTAAQDLSAIYAMARHLDADPVLICGLVSVAISQIADSALEAIIAFDTPAKSNDVQAYRAAVWLDRKPNECWARYMAGEKAFGLYTIDGIFANPASATRAAFGLSGGGGPPFWAGGAILYGGERRCYAAVMDEATARVLKGEPFGDTELMASIDRHSEGTSIFARLLIPVLGRSHISFCRCAEKARTVDAGLAVLAYRLKHERDPKTLEELVPEFLAAVPRSVFYDQLLRLRMDPEGVFEHDTRAYKTFRRDRGVLRIYTVGENGVDDGGLNADECGAYGVGKDDRCFCVPPTVRTPREEWKGK